MAASRQALLSGSQRRTYAALLKAAADLLGAGKTPTVADAAELADVSRRTAYRYFPTQEQLLTEAALETLRSTVESSFTSIEEDPFARLELAVRAIQAEAIKNEHLLRTMIRLTIDRAPEASTSGAPSRGTRRRDWLESAVAPVRPKLTQDAYARLISALCLCVGAEALIVLRDVAGLSEQQAIAVSVWSAKALLTGALTDQRNASPPASTTNRNRCRRANS